MFSRVRYAAGNDNATISDTSTSIAVTVPSRNVATLYESRLIWLNNAHTFVFPQELLVSRVLHWE